MRKKIVVWTNITGHNLVIDDVKLGPEGIILYTHCADPVGDR